MADTIAAVATARGRAGVAILRVSGPDAFACGASFAEPPPVGAARLRRFRDPSGDVIDEGLMLVFPGPRSFTGEDIVEFQIHGSIAVQSRLLELILDYPGVRLAEPGEFTRRALFNGRMDLAQVEGLGDLISAETEAQRKLARRLLEGELGNSVAAWRADLVRAMGLFEAALDFSEEELPPDVVEKARTLILGVVASLKEALASGRAAERVRDGFEVAIIGAPNVGKSTLLNQLAGREAALTSPIAGTTRDVIEVRMDVGGFAVTFLDTAGLRTTTDEVEAMGVERAKSRSAAADIRIFLSDDKPGDLWQAGDIWRTPKADVVGDMENGISGLTGFGVDALLQEIEAECGRRAQGHGVASRLRHRKAIQAGVTDLQAAIAELEQGDARVELAAERLRGGVRALDALVGRVGVEEVLGYIFSEFCIGK